MQKVYVKIHMDDCEIQGPDAIEIVLHPNLKNRINELSGIVKENKVAAVSMLNSLPEIVMLKNGVYVLPESKDDCAKVDVMSLHVTTSTFFWSGYIKFSGDRWTTSELSINHL